MKCCGFLKGTASGTQEFCKTLIYSFQARYRGKLRSVTQPDLLKKTLSTRNLHSFLFLSFQLFQD